MLEETEETIVCFVTFLSLVAFQLKGEGRHSASPPPATPISPEKVFAPGVDKISSTCIEIY